MSTHRPGVFISADKGDAGASVSLTDTVSEILHVSSDSAYRRIRNETPLVLDEAKLLCEHFHLSLDQVLNTRSNSVLLKTFASTPEYSYEAYLSDLIKWYSSSTALVKRSHLSYQGYTDLSQFLF
jgi:hypothetical protein